MGEFYLSLEKDPQQEEFLQGRMQGNPYPSSSPGLGPLMRDVKNKICTGEWECQGISNCVAMMSHHTSRRSSDLLTLWREFCVSELSLF